MNKEIRISIVDICIGYGCVALIMYAVGGIAYTIGKTKAKIETIDNIKEFMSGCLPHPDQK